MNVNASRLFEVLDIFECAIACNYFKCTKYEVRKKAHLFSFLNSFIEIYFNRILNSNLYKAL